MSAIPRRIKELLDLKNTEVESLKQILRNYNPGQHQPDERGPCLCSQCDYARAREIILKQDADPMFVPIKVVEMPDEPQLAPCSPQATEASLRNAVGVLKRTLEKRDAQIVIMANATFILRRLVAEGREIEDRADSCEFSNLLDGATLAIKDLDSLPQ